MLTVIKELPKIGKDVKWLCECKCGNKSYVTTDHLRSGHSKSCGCYKKIATLISKRTHGLSRNPIYNIWGLMITRCYNTKSEAYKHYGERGITVCDEWINSFETFYKDMGDRPTTKHSIERKNNNKGYFKDNCYWATKLQQIRNRRSSLFINYNGKEIALIDFAKMVNKKYKTVHLYFKKYGAYRTIDFYSHHL